MRESLQYWSSSTEGSRALIASSNNAHIRGNQASRTILSSENIILEEPYTVAGGHQSIKWLLDSVRGNGTFAGAISSSLGGYGEYFAIFSPLKVTIVPVWINCPVELSKYSPYPPKEELIAPANVPFPRTESRSHFIAFISGASSFVWQGRYLTNEFGGFIYETVTDEESGELIRVPKQNPDYDRANTYEFTAFLISHRFINKSAELICQITALPDETGGS